MKEHFELIYIVSIKYLEDELQKIIEDVARLIKEFNGEITADQILGKQRLAYPIKHMHQGTYVIVEFDMEKANVKKADDQLKLLDGLLRHLIIRKKIKTAEEIKKEQEIQEKLRQVKEEELAKLEKETKIGVKKTEPREIKPAEEILKEKKEKVEEGKKKVSMEDLDKKLDEILKDEIL